MITFFLLCYVYIKTKNNENRIANNKIANFVKSNYINGDKTRIYIFTNNLFKDTLKVDDGYVNCRIAICENTKQEIYIDYSAEVKIRGDLTSKADKKPYNIRLSMEHNILGFGNAKKWCLLAERYDPTLMRNALFLGLAKKMEMNYTSDYAYVELWFDGEYQGCYLLVEPVESGVNRVNVDFDSGDFLFEFEARKKESGLTYITSGDWRFVINEPKEPSSKQLKEIQKVINSFNSSIRSRDINKVSKIVDLDSFAKLYILNEYAKTLDFSYSSVKFYYSNGKIYAGPVWDFDLSSGNASTSVYPNYWNGALNDSTLGLYCLNNNIFSELNYLDEYREKVKKYFITYYEEFVSLYDCDIDTMQNNNLSLFLSNYEKINGAGWDISKTFYNPYKPYKTYEENVKYLKNWLESRLAYLTNKILNE